MNQKNITMIIGGVLIGLLGGSFLFSNNHTSPDQGHDMHDMMMDMTARMQGKTGDELDKIFLEDMIIHHQGAVDMAVVLQENTTRPELQKMADDIIRVQTEEINMMQSWLDTWFQ